MTGQEPLFSVVCGNPTAEELAAVTVVLLAMTSVESSGDGDRARPSWSGTGYRPPGAWAH
ncbi:hypothetical protein DL991_04505 [Amycolatopsis sp. WAC 01375]|uniref:acyl-CoA carboxylase subunit epsilon n=1 Tax=unclassified Amycolatopsis TaxID=2618356 RepID=UPI000F76EBA8|nr:MULTISPECIES: acyl-CoA carboxylase subunit epsilon [unclassified Amycolatopsis]RSM82627.1 hypothetical protein DL991_04505 [Amycolatopsis sp. WAC 01375]RSN34615.1 hypothetical protein DL990_13300 [Amycolatopsis sp. WAC 01416]